ncbi:hypothetical protein DSO57_1025041, partial [Entomophthora muscae]
MTLIGLRFAPPSNGLTASDCSIPAATANEINSRFGATSNNTWLAKATIHSIRNCFIKPSIKNYTVASTSAKYTQALMTSL